jgi:DeoR/GlpR family transcriptional regulator of sugar metabolism
MTYLTTEELSERIKYNARTIRNDLKDNVLLEGRHYIRPFGQRKILFIWESIEEDMHKASQASPFAVANHAESLTSEDVQHLFH